jgi:hypothetical protein
LGLGGAVALLTFDKGFRSYPMSGGIAHLVRVGKLLAQQADLKAFFDAFFQRAFLQMRDLRTRGRITIATISTIFERWTTDRVSRLPGEMANCGRAACKPQRHCPWHGGSRHKAGMTGERNDCLRPHTGRDCDRPARPFMASELTASSL